MGKKRRPDLDEEPDSTKTDTEPDPTEHLRKHVIYLVCDLADKHRAQINRVLTQTFKVFLVTDIDSARNDLMDGVAHTITIVLYAETVDKRKVDSDIVEICQMRGIRHLPLCEEVCNRILEDPRCILADH